ncbi:hypothetical protein R1flu_015395 [Riccia fluitans]|uniref:Uncharacterized protein n=1 Tax=Riccia fluitans TaxID=41844 RepID=A0ABD1YIU8_9MARC
MCHIVADKNRPLVVSSLKALAFVLRIKREKTPTTEEEGDYLTNSEKKIRVIAAVVDKSGRRSKQEGLGVDLGVEEEERKRQSKGGVGRGGGRRVQRGFRILRLISGNERGAARGRLGFSVTSVFLVVSAVGFVSVIVVLATHGCSGLETGILCSAQGEGIDRSGDMS